MSMGMCSVVVPGGAAMLERSLKGRQVLPAHDFISQCTASEDRRKEEGVVTGQYQYEYDVMKQVLDLPLICKLPTQEDMPSSCHKIATTCHISSTISPSTT